MATTMDRPAAGQAGAVVEHQLYIDGAWRPANSGKTFEVRNPATGALLARCADGGRDEVKDAIQAAHAAFPAWRTTCGVARDPAVRPPPETDQRVPRVIERGGECTAHGLRERQLQEGIAEVLPIVPVQDLPVERRPVERREDERERPRRDPALRPPQRRNPPLGGRARRWSRSG